MLDTALKQIATMQPAQLPEVELPRVPDLSAAEPLAAIAHGNPAPLLESAKNIDLDNATISAALSQARTLVAGCLLYTSPSPRDATLSRMPSSA